MTTQQAVALEPVPIPVTPPTGFWKREASHFPVPLTPLTRTVMIPTINRVFRSNFTENGALLEGIEFQEIGGWMYNRQVPLGGVDRKAPPKWVAWLVVRTVPALRKRIRQNVAAVRADIGWRPIERWYGEWRAELQTRLAALRQVPMESLDDEALAAHVREVVAFSEYACEIHFLLTTPGLVVGDLVFLCQELLGWDERKTLSLLTGLSTMSTEPARQLANLARMARARPAVMALVERADRAAANQLREADQEFAAAFEAYQDEFGFRALRYELAEPTLAEVPEVTLGFVRDQVRRNYDPDAERAASEAARESAIREARTALAARPETEKKRFERALERAIAYYPTREDNEFFTVSAPMALTRFASLEAGRRLAAAGRLAAPEDVFFLERDELLGASGNSEDFRERAARRRGERAWAAANPGPATYGRDPGPPPSLDVLPRETRDTMRAMLWMVDRVFAEDASSRRQAASSTLRGIAAAPGRYTGPARIVMGEDQFDRIEAGDVLVCPITSPVWSILFPSVGALVTDSGGILSHPAIIAREYGIPAVVGTGNGTELLRDGQQITVDGEAGTITLE